MWGSALAIKWGAATDAVVLHDGKGQGNNIAVFPTYVQGICAQLDLWRTSDHYKNKRFADAINIWSGGNEVESYIRFVTSRVPGMTRDTIMNDAFWHSPMGIAFLKAQAWHEAGKQYPAPDADWIEAQKRVLGGGPTMNWRLAQGLKTLRSQVNEKWPNRSRSSDGDIGDSRHAARVSDHNPDASGIVHAIDITHDPKGGFDSYAFADLILKKQDRRLRYVISNRRIGSGPAGPSPGVWRPYSGTNPHDHHCHISIVSGPAADVTDAWDIGGAVSASPEVAKVFVPPPPTLHIGSVGNDVRKLQAALRIPDDGYFGPSTDTALKKFQADHSMVVDGICGPQVWRAIQTIPPPIKVPPPGTPVARPLAPTFWGRFADLFKPKKAS
jgi:hypothetical protein